MGLLIKKNICLMGLLANNKYIYALWAYSQTINIYALWAYSQKINIYMPYGPTCKQ